MLNFVFANNMRRRALSCMESHEDPAEMPAELAYAAAQAAQGEQRSGEFVARSEPATFWTADAVKRLVSLHAGNTPQMLQQLAQGLQHAPELRAAFGTAAELQCAHSDCVQPAVFGHLEGVGTPSTGPRYCSVHKLAGMSNIAESSMPSMTSARSPLLPSAASFAENLEGHAGTHWMNIGAAGGRSSSSRASPVGLEGSATYMGALLTRLQVSWYASPAAERDPCAAQCLWQRRTYTIACGGALQFSDSATNTLCTLTLCVFTVQQALLVQGRCHHQMMPLSQGACLWPPTWQLCWHLHATMAQ
jgi:hypothetical protein